VLFAAVVIGGAGNHLGAVLGAILIPVGFEEVTRYILPERKRVIRAGAAAVPPTAAAPPPSAAPAPELAVPVSAVPVSALIPGGRHL
jgi:ABC-type branched-subunit amino acid transport system permease subunit